MYGNFNFDKNRHSENNIVQLFVQQSYMVISFGLACALDLHFITNVHWSMLITIWMKEKTSVFLENYIEH